ncbi:protein quiver-like [Plakobranchus ocellatus]|uniref:Protein quiver-like n=1 Tax=Plakobranchus ocellatus TaxID=259542 RepID=A0AAV4BNI7_9GAST|nr:protein quiver-like [Plakobranchus ocellatus]
MNFLILGWILSLLFVTVFSLECYQCQTLAGIGCDDPFNKNLDSSAAFLGECDEGSYCVKYKTVVKLRDSGYINGWERHSVVVTRACEPRLGKTQRCTGWQNNGGITIKCWCGSDGCNSGRALVPAQAVTIMCFIGVVLALARRLL